MMEKVLKIINNFGKFMVGMLFAKIEEKTFSKKCSSFQTLTPVFPMLKKLTLKTI
jgi:hypothetical protein